MRLKCIALAMFVWSLTITCLAAGDSGAYLYKRISIEQGLSHPRVQSVCQDHKGIFWIGTQSGLNVFDHYTLKNYHAGSDSGTLFSDYINFVVEDQLQNIWVSSSSKMMLYDKSQDQFTPVTHNGQVLRGFSYVFVAGGIIFGGTDALVRYDYKTRQMTTLAEGLKLGGDIDNLVKIDQDRLVFGSRFGGVWMFDLRTGVCSPGVTNKISKSVYSLFVDSGGNMWVGLYNKGVVCVDRYGVIKKHLTVENSEMNNNVVLDIEQYQGQIWMATDGGGINIYDPITDQFSFINNRVGDALSIGASSFFTLYVDHQDNMWAGSIREGLIRIKSSNIHTFGSSPLGTPYGLSHKSVISIYEQSHSELWIGTDGGGLNLYNPTTGVFEHCVATYGEKIASIARFSERELILSAFNKGLFLFDIATRQMRPFLMRDKDETRRQFSTGDLVNLFCTGDRTLYILGTHIVRYRNGKYEDFRLDGVSDFRQRGMQVLNYADGKVYIFGPRDVFCLDEKSDKIETVISLDEGVLITAGCMDAQGAIWLGTNEGLFVSYGKGSEKVQKVSTKLFASISALTCDRNGRLWIGANNMLFCYVIAESRFIIFGESDGASANNFIFTPTLTSHSANIYLGGTAGLICINPAIMTKSYGAPQITLLDALVDGASVVNLYDGNYGDISVPYSHSSLQVKVIAAEDDIFRRKRFRYSIKGLQGKVIESYDHMLTLGQLGSGSYTLSVSCNLPSGEWSEPVDVATFVVEPPLWRTWWVMLLMGLTVCSMGGYVIWTGVRRRAQKLRWAVQQVEVRNYQDRIHYLINISHELRTPLTLILTPLKSILRSPNNRSDGERRELRSMYNHVKHMGNIINMVLEVQKAEAGRSSLKIEYIKLPDWINAIIEEFRYEYENRGVMLSSEFSPQVDVVGFDNSKCKIVLTNLMINALKFSPAHSSVCVRSELRVGSMVRISVEDRGIGLDNVDVNKLFTIFYQGNHDRYGSGIGLSYAKMLVEQHGGTIGAYANAHGGATFYYDLPIGEVSGGVTVVIPPTPMGAVRNEVRSIEKAVLGSASVLVVDDDRQMCEFLERSVRSYFKKVFVAFDGATALEITRDRRPSIVLSDIVMPGMNGFELCRQIKTELAISHIPVVLLTCQSDTETAEMGYKMGADAYLTKPFEVDFLLSTLCSVLENRQVLRSNSADKLSEAKSITFSAADETFVLRLNEIIETNIAQTSFNINALASQIGMSRTSLYDKLRKITGLSINDYINRRRIDLAAELLLTTTRSVTEISEQVGFTSQRYFSTKFRRERGVSPSQWRDNNA